MRGKVAVLGCAVGAHGITPAYAGKSVVAVVVHALHGDHPRVCGEKLSQSRSRSTALGSPPRMRGKVSGFFRTHFRPGITPAYAGKSYCLCLPSKLVRDHPRVCGEKTKKIP